MINRLPVTGNGSHAFGESTTTRIAGALDFTAIGGKRQGARSAPIVENNAVKPGAKNPVWKTQ
jgi:hypothetical protein